MLDSMLDYLCSERAGHLLYWNSEYTFKALSGHNTARDPLPVLYVLAYDEEVGLNEPLNDLAVPLLTSWEFPDNRYRLEKANYY